MIAELQHSALDGKSWQNFEAGLCRYKAGDRPPQPQRTFQNTWRARCEDDWLRAFYMFSFSGLPRTLSMAGSCALAEDTHARDPSM